jgi:hypothetical protein
MSLWTPAEYETAKTMRCKGASYAEIARKIGRTAKAVEQRLAKPAASMKTRPWSPTEDAMMRKNRAAGWTFRRIAEAMGRPVKTVESRATAIGLPRLVNCDHAARAAASHASLLKRIGYAPDKPCGYDAKTAKWALGNWKMNEEARLVAVHLGLSGDKRGRAVIAALRTAMAMQAAA